jgi:hypothetical protein
LCPEPFAGRLHLTLCDPSATADGVGERGHHRSEGLFMLNPRIIANFGDQFSDLIGGHGKPVKLPNPTYSLP